jgi:hypothetical protein
MVLDRFEENYAICEEMETQKTVAVLIDQLPSGAMEGDVLVSDDTGITVDAAATRERRERIQKLFDDLLES